MSDPTAVEADKTKEEMTMATIIKQTKEEINWAEIARAREMGVLDKLLAERDVIRFHLRSGTEVAIMVEKVEPGLAWMGFVDGVAERPMYSRLERPVSWKESDARKWCNTDLVQDLPEDLVSIITPPHHPPDHQRRGAGDHGSAMAAQRNRVFRAQAVGRWGRSRRGAAASLQDRAGPREDVGRADMAALHPFRLFRQR